MKEIKQKQTTKNINELDLSNKDLAKNTIRTIKNPIKGSNSGKKDKAKNNTDIDDLARAFENNNNSQSRKSPYLHEQEINIDKKDLARNLNPIKRPTPISDIKKINKTKKEIRDIKEKKLDLSIRGRDYTNDYIREPIIKKAPQK